MTVVQLVRGDALYNLTLTMTDSDGSAVDVSGATVKFRASKYGNTTTDVDGTCTTTQATSGICVYTITTRDFTTVGLYMAELEATYGTGKIITAKLDDIEIIGDVP